MRKEIRVSAPDVRTLREVLGAADVDFGCRPVARRTGGKVSAVALANDEELARFNARRSVGVEIEVLRELPSPEERLRMSAPVNRFRDGGSLPRGLGRKE